MTVTRPLAVACTAGERLDDRPPRIKTEIVGAERDWRGLGFL